MNTPSNRLVGERLYGAPEEAKSGRAARALPYKALALALTAFWLAAAVAPASAKDREFGLFVRHIGSYYHAHRSHRLLIGFAGGLGNVVIKFWRPYGVKNFKLAMFEDQDFSASRDDLDFPAVIRAGINAGWSPLIQVWSRRDGERTYVFARATGKNDVKVLVVTLEQNEAVVVEAKFNPDKLSRAIERWTEDPNSIRRPFAPEPDRAPGDNPVLAQASAEAQAPKPNENKVRAPTAMVTLPLGH